MAQYQRRGHYRQGKNGQRIWVSGHTVNRSSGSNYFRDPSPNSRYNSGYSTPTAPASTTTGAAFAKGRLPRSTRWVKANASCPVCGALVYFYSNEHGSRVYFDEVGPPWPKHPCTDTGSARSPGDSEKNRRLAPRLYDISVGRKNGSHSGFAAPPAFPNSRNSSEVVGRFEPFTVKDAQFVDGNTRLGLQRLYRNYPRKRYFASGEVNLTIGQLVFLGDGWISYFDEVRMKVIEIIVRRSAEATSATGRRGLFSRWTSDS